MSRQYPIWIAVTACIYQGDKSYGAKDCNTQKVSVGSSRSNSHDFCEIMIYKRTYENYKGYTDVMVFKIQVDGKRLKEMIFKNNKGVAGEFIGMNEILSKLEELK